MKISRRLTLLTHLLLTLVLSSSSGNATPRSSTSAFTGRDEILLLTIPSAKDERLAEADRSTPRNLLRNLVLYLHTPPGERTVIERAAISISDSEAALAGASTKMPVPPLEQLGREIQELRELQGVRFSRDHFMRTERWLRDVNYDGHPDLVFSLPDSPTRLYIYAVETGAYIVDDHTFESEPVLVYVGGSEY